MTYISLLDRCCSAAWKFIQFAFILLNLTAALWADGEVSASQGGDIVLAAAARPIVRPLEPAQAKPAPSNPLGFELKLFDTKTAKGTYSRKGLRIESKSGNYKTRIRVRTQLRYSWPVDVDPRKDSKYGLVATDEVYMRRARLKIDGNLFGNWFKYTYEHGLVNNVVLNLYADIKVKEWLQFRTGQWKASFTRERVTSSSKQQFVERSIVNRAFTVDRQAGFQVQGHLMPGTRGDSWYYAGIYTGTGRGNGFESGGHPMYLARYQWNFLGKDISFSGSDLEHHRSPAASFAISGVTNRSRYTRFSGSGGGQLDGYEMGAPGQYSLKQANAELTLKYRGLSIQNENHWKNIYDNVNFTSTDMRGSYAQAGYFLHNIMPNIPKFVEVGYRYAYVDMDTNAGGDLRQEHVAVLNLFFEGHDNKLSIDAGRVYKSRIGLPSLSSWRYRVQWDVHF